LRECYGPGARSATTLSGWERASSNEAQSSVAQTYIARNLHGRPCDTLRQTRSRSCRCRIPWSPPLNRLEKREPNGPPVKPGGNQRRVGTRLPGQNRAVEDAAQSLEAYANSCKHNPNASRQSVKCKSNLLCNFAVLNREFRGLRAGVGYSLVDIGIISLTARAPSDG
jgi:hypothetical protein